MKKTAILVTVLAVTAVALACSDSNGSKATATPESINPADFQSTIGNPYYPISSVVGPLIYEGTEPNDSGEDVSVRDELRTLPGTTTIAGVEVTVQEDKAYENGELVELTHDYFAQHTDGTVYYFGEDVDEYENGEVVSHEGSWRAGEGDNLPGIFMPINPTVGMSFDQERAPGIAEDTSKVIAINQNITTGGGAFSGCIKTEDYDPLGDQTEHKYYCPGFGLVREETEPSGSIELISF